MEAEDAERPGDPAEVAATPAEGDEPMETEGDKQQVRYNDRGIWVTLGNICTLIRIFCMCSELFIS